MPGGEGKLRRVQKENRDLVLGFCGALLAMTVFRWLASQVLQSATIEFDAAVRDGIHPRG